MLMKVKITTAAARRYDGGAQRQHQQPSEVEYTRFPACFKFGLSAAADAAAACRNTYTSMIQMRL